MPKALPQQAIAQFRSELCRVAARRFAELGYAGVTLRALADELGCSRMTPYRYFKDKADILSAVQADGYRRLAEVQEAARDSESDPFRRVVAVAGAYLRFAADEPDRYRLMFELPREPHSTPSADLAQQATRSQLPLFESVRDATRTGVLGGDATTLTHLLWAALHGLASLHLADRLQMGRSYEVLCEALLAQLAMGARTAAQ